MSWKILDFVDSWAVVKLLLLDRKLAFTSMLRSNWHKSKQKLYNWSSNKSDLGAYHDRLANSRWSHAIRKSIGITSGPRITTTARPPWYTCDTPFVSLSAWTLALESQPRPDRRDTLATDIWLTCDSLPLISDRPTTWARPPRVTCLTPPIFGWDKNFKSDLRPINDHAEWHTRPSSDLWPTCEDLWPKEDPVASWVTSKWNWQVPQPILMVKSGRGACWFQWGVGPRYCEYSGE